MAKTGSSVSEESKFVSTFAYLQYIALHPAKLALIILLRLLRSYLLRRLILLHLPTSRGLRRPIPLMLRRRIPRHRSRLRLFLDPFGPRRSII